VVIFALCVFYLEEPAIAAPKRNRVNREITSYEVRFIDAEGNQVGIVNLADAQERATEAGLDLVEIVPNAEPPVCRLMDFGKFLFDQKKKEVRGPQETKAGSGQGGQIPSRNGRGRLSGQAAQPDAVPERWGQG